MRDLDREHVPAAAASPSVPAGQEGSPSAPTGLPSIHLPRIGDLQRRWRKYRAERRLYRELAREGESWWTCRRRVLMGLRDPMPLEVITDWEGEVTDV